LEREEPRKSNAIPLDIARSMVVLWFNGISGTRGQFRDIEKECIAEPYLWDLRGCDGEMRVGAFLRQKRAVFVVLLFVVFFALAATQSFGAEAPTHSILPGFQEDESRVGQAKIQIARTPISQLLLVSAKSRKTLKLYVGTIPQSYIHTDRLKTNMER
jgi:hypothetical protein